VFAMSLFDPLENAARRGSGSRVTRSNGAAMTTRHRRRAVRAGLWLLIAALHLALLYGLNGTGPSRWRAWLVPEPGIPLVVRLIDPPPAAPRALPQAGAAVPATYRTAPAPAPARPLAASPQAITAEPAPIEASPVAAAASAPVVTRALDLRLPHGTAERGGQLAPDSIVRQALNDPRSNVRRDPRQALPDAVAAAAKGDCMKGEYFSLATGLLSVPFLAYAALAGNCQPQR